MPEKIKMVYPLMEEMAKTFQKGSEQLKETTNQMQGVAGSLQDGALLGQGGVAFTDAINSKLVPALNRLQQKFDELQKDVLNAMKDMQQADQTSKGLMG